MLLRRVAHGRRLWRALGFRPVELMMLKQDVTIGFLADHPTSVRVVSRWVMEQWGERRDSAAIDEFGDSLRRQLNRDCLPTQLVAILDGQVVGVAMLKEHELTQLFPDKRNWLGSVFVDPASRGRGIATSLVQRAVHIANVLGIPELHLQTEDLGGGLYARLGWKRLCEVSHRGIARLVMTKETAF